jgi:hypothetical protein
MGFLFLNNNGTVAEWFRLFSAKVHTLVRIQSVLLMIKELTMEKNEIKKDLYKSKNLARFSHYVGGNLYYKVDVLNGTYQFPIKTVQKSFVMDSFEREKIATLILAEDLGTTTFDAEIKGSELIRWIEKAIDNEDFIKVG